MKTAKAWTVAALLCGLLVFSGSAAGAGYCGSECYRHCRVRVARCSVCPAVPCPCQPAGCEEKTVTEYESKFKEVEHTKVIDVVKFVEDVEEREVTVTVWEEKRVPVTARLAAAAAKSWCPSNACARSRCR